MPDDTMSVVAQPDGAVSYTQKAIIYFRDGRGQEGAEAIRHSDRQTDRRREQQRPFPSEDLTAFSGI